MRKNVNLKNYYSYKVTNLKNSIKRREILAKKVINEEKGLFDENKLQAPSNEDASIELFWYTNFINSLYHPLLALINYGIFNIDYAPISMQMPQDSSVARTLLIEQISLFLRLFHLGTIVVKEGHEENSAINDLEIILNTSLQQLIEAYESEADRIDLLYENKNKVVRHLTKK